MQCFDIRSIYKAVILTVLRRFGMIFKKYMQNLKDVCLSRCLEWYFLIFNVKSELVTLVQKYFLKDGWVVYLCPFKNLFFVHLDLYKGYIPLSYLQRSKQQQQIMATIIIKIIAPKITSPIPNISIFVQNEWGFVTLQKFDL